MGLELEPCYLESFKERMKLLVHGDIQLRQRDCRGKGYCPHRISGLYPDKNF